MNDAALMPRTHVIKWVFFDLYGTLIDIRTDERSETAWQALYEKLRGFGVEYESVGIARPLRDSRRVRCCAKPIAVPLRDDWEGIRYSPGLSFSAHRQTKRG